MGKKISKIFILSLFLSILLIGCLNLNYSNEKNYEKKFSDILQDTYGYVPDSNILKTREYKPRELVVGYENLESLNILIEKLDENIEEKEIIPEIKVALLKLNNIEVEE